jgi:hypothetical protein
VHATLGCKRDALFEVRRKSLKVGDVAADN